MATHNNPTSQDRPQRRGPKKASRPRARRRTDPFEPELDDDFLNEALAALHHALHREPPAVCRLCLTGLFPAPAPLSTDH